MISLENSLFCHYIPILKIKKIINPTGTVKTGLSTRTNMR